MIPNQLQEEVRACLEKSLRQGIIYSLKHLHASQVVIMWKPSGEVCQHVAYFKLNAFVVYDAFPLPRIDEAIQAVQDCQWYSSIDLVQGYLQLPMDE